MRCLGLPSTEGRGNGHRAFGGGRAHAITTTRTQGRAKGCQHGRVTCRQVPDHESGWWVPDLGLDSLSGPPRPVGSAATASARGGCQPDPSWSRSPTETVPRSLSAAAASPALPGQVASQDGKACRVAAWVGPRPLDERWWHPAGAAAAWPASSLSSKASQQTTKNSTTVNHTHATRLRPTTNILRNTR